MGQTETPADQAAVAKQLAHLFGQRIGGYVEILGHDAQHQIADAASNQEALKASVTQAIQHA